MLAGAAGGAVLELLVDSERAPAAREAGRPVAAEVARTLIADLPAPQDLDAMASTWDAELATEVPSERTHGCKKQDRWRSLSD